MTRVLTFGTFDGLHPGHRSYLEQARQQGDELIVVIARDATVQAVKNHPALHSELERMRAVEASGLTDRVVLGNQGDRLRILAELKPDVICLGYDQDIDEKNLQRYLDEHDLQASIVRCKPFHPEQYKSTLLNNK